MKAQLECSQSPPGVDGVYYFSTYIVAADSHFALIDMRLNDDVICSTRPDHSTNGSGDTAPGSCSAVVDIVAGVNVEF